MQITHAFLKEHGLLPNKSTAQYLITDTSVVDDTVRALDVSPGDRILEIGAGCGALTERILEEIDRTADGNPGSLTSVEIDDRYVEFLRSRFVGKSSLTVLREDVLKLDIPRILGGKGKVVGNIPYYLSGPILRLMFDNHAVVTDVVMMLQEEVGMRVVSSPSDEYFGLLSIMRMLHYDAAIVRQVNRNLFLPVPKVDSIVIRMHVHKPLISREDEYMLIRILKQAFSARRKMIKNTLKAVGTRDEVMGWCTAAEIDLDDRAENIDLERWIRFLNAYKKTAS